MTGQRGNLALIEREYSVLRVSEEENETPALSAALEWGILGPCTALLKDLVRHTLMIPAEGRLAAWQLHPRNSMF